MSNAGIVREKADVEATGTMTDNTLIRGDGEKRIQDSGVTLDDSDNMTGVNTLAVTDAPTTRSNLGLGSLSTQDANNVTISGGSVTGITDLAVADGGTGASNASDARTNLGLVIGTNVQAWDAGLENISGLAVTDSNIIVGNGSAWIAESGATARTSLGLGTIATQAADNVAITGGSVTGITDVTVADGGTGASSLTAYSVVCGGITATDPLQAIASVGTSGQVLTSAGAGALPTFETISTQASPVVLVSAQLYGPDWQGSSVSNQTHAADLISLIPISFPVAFTMDQIQFNVQSAATAGKSARIGIYNCDGNGPTTVLRTFGTVLIDSTGDKTISDTYTIPVGNYFFAYQGEASAGIYSGQTPRMFLPLTSIASPASRTPRYTAAWAGALIDLTSATPVSYMNAWCPLMVVRKS